MKPRLLMTALRWPVGLLLTWWAYIWRTTPMHRREVDGAAAENAPPPLPHGVSLADVQRPQDGKGKLLRRRYRVDIDDPGCGPATLMARLRQDPNQVVPGGLARFHKIHGGDGLLDVGDEFTVRMPGPWDGPVRVVEVTPTSFRFATLDGHLEAGRRRLVIENDDRSFGLGDVLELHRRTGLRVVWDAHHHACLNPDAIPEADALRAALATWPDGVVPKIHFSSPREPGSRAHADMIDAEAFRSFLRGPAAGLEFDTMLEAKTKDLALLALRDGLSGDDRVDVDAVAHPPAGELRHALEN
jgi:hypothetical protein